MAMKQNSTILTEILARVRQQKAESWLAEVGFVRGSNDNISIDDLKASQVDWRCLGSLITARHVLSSASCLVGANRTSANVVRLGQGFKKQMQIIAIAHIDLYPLYRVSIENGGNIGLATLKRKAKTGRYVSTIALPTAPHTDYMFRALMVAGLPDSWKRHKPHSAVIHTSETCKVALLCEKPASNVKWDHSMFCATMIGDIFSNESSITTGAEIIYVLEKGRAELVGVGNCENYCQLFGFKQTFTSVFEHFEWIYSLIVLPPTASL